MVSQHRKYISSFLFLFAKQPARDSDDPQFPPQNVRKPRGGWVWMSWPEPHHGFTGSPSFLEVFAAYALTKPTYSWGRFPGTMVSSLRGVCYHDVLRCALWRDGLWQNTYNMESAVCRDHARKNVNHGGMNSFHLHIKKQNRCLLGGSWATDLNDDDDDDDDDMSENGSSPPVPGRNVWNEVDEQDGYFLQNACTSLVGRNQPGTYIERSLKKTMPASFLQCLNQVNLSEWAFERSIQSWCFPNLTFQKLVVPFSQPPTHPIERCLLQAAGIVIRFCHRLSWLVGQVVWDAFL